MLENNEIMMNLEEAFEGSSCEQIELRSRNARNSSENRTRWDKTIKGMEKAVIEKPLKPGDNLNKIALEYSVSLHSLKRANNIVSDQDIYALPFIKIPVSKMRKEFDMEYETNLLKNDCLGEPIGSKEIPTLVIDSGHSSNKSVKELFEKADASIAQVRSNLPNIATDGAFHFVDASSPDSNFREKISSYRSVKKKELQGLWFVLVFVVFVFVFIPLILTFVEEEQVELRDTKKNSVINY